MVVVQSILLEHALSIKQQATNLKVGQLRKTVPKYSIQLAVFIHLLRAIKHSTLCGSELQHHLQIQV